MAVMAQKQKVRVCLFVCVYVLDYRDILFIKMGSVCAIDYVCVWVCLCMLVEERERGSLLFTIVHSGLWVNLKYYEKYEKYEQVNGVKDTKGKTTQVAVKCK